MTGDAPAARPRCGRLAVARGYTLIELMIAMAVGVGLFAGVLLVVIGASNAQNHTANRADAEFTAEAGVSEIGRLIRQATGVSYVGGNQYDISLTGGPLGATTINCPPATGTCTVSGGGTGQPLSSVTNTDVFTLECRQTGSNSSDLTTTGCGSYSYVNVRAVLSISCSHQEAGSCASNNVELDDGFNLSS